MWLEQKLIHLQSKAKVKNTTVKVNFELVIRWKQKVKKVHPYGKNVKF